MFNPKCFKMTQKMRIALAQINCTVGDLSGNLAKIRGDIRKAEEFGADLVVFPELAITGYPPEDLLLKARFIDDNLDAMRQLAGSVGQTAVIAGFVDRKGQELFNALAVIYDGKIKGVYHKMFLPNYGVFDEKRYFAPGSKPAVFGIGKMLFGATVCEDIWHLDGPVEDEARAGAGLVVNINSSPYHMGKTREREDIVRKQARDNKVAIAYVNMVGGQDELVFDGQSMLVDQRGQIIRRAAAFKEELLLADIEVAQATPKKIAKAKTICQAPGFRPKIAIPEAKASRLEPTEEAYSALLSGLSDYVIKNGFRKVVIGLSGGIDSALVATLAVDALGKDNVIGVFMPSRYSSQESEKDARELAGNLGIKFSSISIEQLYKIYLLILEPHFAGTERNIAEENLQARIRGTVLMALSNKFGWLVLATGNKSEMSTGYATLYGDMAGGFAVIKDVPKTLVYKLCRYRNSLGKVIPENVFTKAPTAELKNNQKDSDTLPVYDELDPILKAYVEEDKDFKTMVSAGYAPETVKRVVEMVDRSEYKRRQSPPGIKITPKSFGKDRRMPITNKYRT